MKKYIAFYTGVATAIFAVGGMLNSWINTKSESISYDMGILLLTIIAIICFIFAYLFSPKYKR